MSFRLQIIAVILRKDILTMKKRILAVLCAAAVMLSLTACSDNASTSGGSSVQDSTSSVAESASSDNADDSSTESTESTESSESEESQGGEYVKYVLDG